MGWTEFKPKNKKDGTISLCAEMNKELNESNFKILASQVINSIYYAAIKVPSKKKSKIIAIVCPVHLSEDGWVSYKMIDEEMGPFYYDCPNDILRLLSPTNSKEANEWRDKCKNNSW